MDDKGLYIVTGATGRHRPGPDRRALPQGPAGRDGLPEYGKGGSGPARNHAVGKGGKRRNNGPHARHGFARIDRTFRRGTSIGRGRDRSAGQQRRRDERPFRPDRRRNRAVHGRQLRGALRIDPAAAADDRGRGTDRQYAVGHLPHRPDRSPTFRARAATVRTFQELRLVEAGAAAVHARAGPANGGTHRRLRGRPGAWSTRA